ncbi:MAG: hypothetical protein HFG05_05490 [Oscillibacter sp.]|nr:hypothetical protein [Oscillibacter sp.]
MEEFTAQETLEVYVIGKMVLERMRREGDLKELAALVESKATRALEDIRRALDDINLEDPECFHRIEAILTVYENNGIRTSRHDF